MNPCSVGKKHKWQFVKNVIHTTFGARTASLSQRGIYRCECGERKSGPAGMIFEPAKEQGHE